MGRCVFQFVCRTVVVGHMSVATLLPTFAMAADEPPTDKQTKVDAILDTLHVGQQILAVFDSNIPNLTKKLKLKNPNMTDDQYDVINLMLQNMGQKYQNDIIQMYKMDWIKIFSYDEIDSYYGFLQTQEGFDLVAKQRTTLDTDITRKVNEYNSNIFLKDLNDELRSSDKLNQLNVITAQDLRNQVPSPEQNPAASPVNTVMPGQGKTMTVIRFAPSGVQQRIGNFTAVFADCSSMGIAAIRISKPPEHGALTTEEMPLVSDFGLGPREHCNGKPYPSQIVLYKSEPQYVGKDTANTFVIFPDGTAAEWDFTIDVK